MKYKWLCLLVILIYGSTLSAQDLGFDYIIQRDGKEISFTEELGLRVYDISPNQIVGWNTSGKYWMTYYQDPDKGTMAIVIDFRTPESFPMITDIIINNIYPVHFDDEQFTFIELVQDMLVSEDEQGLAIMRVNVYQWAFDEGLSAITKIGTIPYGFGCGGGGVRSAIDSVYSTEVRGDTSGEYNRKLLVPTPHGIVHTNSCTSIRTYLTNPDNTEFIELSDNLRWATVSPDGNWVVGTSSNQLHLINLKTLEITIVTEADAPIYSITWADDSDAFYYVARTTDGEQLPFDDPDNMLDTIEEKLFENAPQADELLDWDSTLYRYDIANNTSTELYHADAYAIGNMSWVYESLVFNQIEHPTAWLQSIIDGGNGLDSSLIPVTLMQVDTLSGDIAKRGDNFRGIYIRPPR